MGMFSSKNKTLEEDIIFRLKYEAEYMISFIEEVDQYPCLYANKNIVDNAIRRYETIWIPFCMSHPATLRVQFVPPIDIEWIQHCHMLGPVQYANDMKPFGGIFEHKLMNRKQRDEGKALTQKYWKSYTQESYNSKLSEPDILDISSATLKIKSSNRYSLSLENFVTIFDNTPQTGGGNRASVS